MNKIGFALIGILLLVFSATAQTVKFDQVKEQCKGLKQSERVRVSVSSFDVSTVRNPGQFGDELAQMLTDALQNVNCFNVLLSIKDSKALSDEIAFGQSGATASKSSPSSGKMKGAQVIVIGKVTSFSSGEKSGQFAGVKLSGGNQAKVGMIIQLVNAETREMIASKSIQVTSKGAGFKGVRMFNVNFAGEFGNDAVQEACQDGIIQAVEFIASRKEVLNLPETGGSRTSTTSSSARPSAAATGGSGTTNCQVLQAAYIPKIMVILPEFHFTQRIPDPAGETEITRKLIEAGFPVVDHAVYATMYKDKSFEQAAKDQVKAIALAKKHGADIVIYGEAFSQRAGVQGKMISCRARTEVRAVRTDNLAIIAANGMEAGALDLAEFVAAKSALREAASLTTDYLLEQFCSKNLTFTPQKQGQISAVPAGGGGAESSTVVKVLRTDYSKMKPLIDLLSTRGHIESRSIANGSGNIVLAHEGATEDIADFIVNKAGTKYSIESLDTGEITIRIK